MEGATGQVPFVDYDVLQLHTPDPLTGRELERLGIATKRVSKSKRGDSDVALAVPEGESSGEEVYRVEKEDGESERSLLSELPLRAVIRTAVQKEMLGEEATLSKQDTVPGVLAELTLPGIQVSHSAVRSVAALPIRKEWMWNLSVVRRRFRRWQATSDSTDLSENQLAILNAQLEAWLPEAELPPLFCDVLENYLRWFAAADVSESHVRALVLHSGCNQTHNCSRIREIGFSLVGHPKSSESS